MSVEQHTPFAAAAAFIAEQPQPQVTVPAQDQRRSVDTTDAMTESNHAATSRRENSQEEKS